MWVPQIQCETFRTSSLIYALQENTTSVSHTWFYSLPVVLFIDFYIFYKYTPIIFVVLCLYILRPFLLFYQFYEVYFKGKPRELRKWAGTSTNTSKLITNLKQNANVLFDVMTRNSQVTIRASVVELLITYFSIKVSRMKIIRGQWRLIAHGTANFSAVANEYIFLKELQII